MAKKISQLTQATQVKSDDVTVIVQDGETKKLPLNMMVTKQDIENKKVAGLAKLDEIEATYENDTYTPTITVKNKSSVKVGEGDGVDYSANVMDGHAKSAILSGNTVVNLINGHQLLGNGNVFTTYENGIYTYQSRTEYTSAITPSNILTLTTLYKLELNKTYTLFVTQLSSNNCQFGIDTLRLNDDGSATTIQRVLESTSHNGEVHKITFTLTSDYDLLRLRLNAYESTERSLQFKNISILEGDWTNVDIPYFEGMQSVKMSVLTTTGKNLFDFNANNVKVGNVSYVISNDSIAITQTRNTTSGCYVAFPCHLKAGTRYTYRATFDNPQNNNIYIRVSHVDGNDYGQWYTDTMIDSVGSASLTLTCKNDGCHYLYLYNKIYETAVNVGSIVTWSNIQFEEGAIATSHEPYKSNILTVNEEVELRGIGEVQDTLDCLTGELTQRIGEDVLDGSEDWIVETNENWSSCRFKLNKTFTTEKYTTDKIITNGKYIGGYVSSGVNTIRISNNAIYIFDTTFTTVNEFKNYLQQNPLTMQYSLSTESIKTVDLMPSGTHPSTTPYCWKNGHIQLSSSGLLPNLEYSVVTSRAGQINQNATMIVKNDKRIFDLEILLAGGLVNTTYQALTLQNQVETGLSKVSLNSETEPDYLLYHMIMKLIEEKAYKLDDLTEKVSVFYLYEKLSDEQFETIYSALYPFVEDEIVEEPVVEELPEVVEDEVIM